jgi:hypothetical protein
MAQTGQDTIVWVEVAQTVIKDAAVSSCHVSRRSEVVSGNKREKNAVPSMQGRCEQEAILSLNIHPCGQIEPHHQKRARATLRWIAWQESPEYAAAIMYGPAVCAFDNWGTRFYNRTRSSPCLGKRRLRTKQTARCSKALGRCRCVNFLTPLFCHHHQRNTIKKSSHFKDLGASPRITPKHPKAPPGLWTQDDMP